jgi:D-alanyl-D-alanine carboxypeptidase
MSLFATPGPEKVVQHFDRYFSKVQAKNPTRPLQIRVYSQKLGLDYMFPPNSEDQPYHIASIGKVFTAVLVQRLAQRGALSLQDEILRFFTPADLDKLFLFQGTDYAREVTIEHLLGHTSGIADYFEGIADAIEGSTRNRKTFIDEVLTDPSHHWTPRELVDYTRTYQKAVGVPGKRFNYSDTGYILLGLMIEKVTGMSFDQNLTNEIFAPLAMRDSHLMFYSEPQNTPGRDIAEIWLNGVEVSGFESLSCDWSGGGIIATTADLLKFNQALRSEQLIPASALETMDICKYRFQPGIYYGLGMMEIRFKEFFFLLGRLPRVKGHIGILATHMFYDPVQDAHVIINLGDNKRMVASFRALIEIENALQRMK